MRILQGDGIDLKMIKKILENTEKRGYCTDSLFFGCGGALLQKFDRDTLKFAIKCSEIQINKEKRDVWKNPVTDPGKKNKVGRLKLIRNDLGELVTCPESDPGENLLVPVFQNGIFVKKWTFGEIRERAAL